MTDFNKPNHLRTTTFQALYVALWVAVPDTVFTAVAWIHVTLMALIWLYMALATRQDLMRAACNAVMHNAFTPRWLRPIVRGKQVLFIVALCAVPLYRGWPVLAVLHFATLLAADMHRKRAHKVLDDYIKDQAATAAVRHGDASYPGLAD